MLCLEHFNHVFVILHLRGTTDQ
uniref:Uncharacterized protein n=1 Tax=Anguilla anguilla TaxID=7936 RepID=A0A0E9RFF1_ANGAN